MPDGRTWMAENLKYKTKSRAPKRRKPDKDDHHHLLEMLSENPKAGMSQCFKGDEPDCGKYGRLYGWNAAAEACPVGWRLPTKREWDILGQAVGGTREYNQHISMTFWYGAGTKLKARSGWKDCEGRLGNGTDDYGFSARPGPGGGYGAWWAAPTKGSLPYGLDVRCGDDFMAGEYYYDDTHVEVFGPSLTPMGPGLAVRCIKDESEEEALQRKQLRMEEERRRLEKLSVYFTDSRDARKYRAVEIGGKTWMAENLNYQPQAGNSWCYNDSASYCDKYGRLYDWETALAVCPAGWRLPSRLDWDGLGQAVGGERRFYEDYYDLSYLGARWYGAGKALKAKTGWEETEQTAVGTDDYGFSALPGVSRYKPPKESGFRFFYDGDIGFWWTATEFDSGGAYYQYVGGTGNNVHESGVPKTDGYSVRCVQNESMEQEQAREIKEQRKKEEERIRLEKLSAHFTDPRDGRKYRVVKIGGNTWTAENLNYRSNNSWCYDNDTSNCGKYGRLYAWEAAKTVCPAGWHLPSVKEWDDLTGAAGGKKKSGPARQIGVIEHYWDGAGKKLKARSGWSAYKGNSGDGTDDYGFSALPGGQGCRKYNSDSKTYYIDKFYYASNLGFWWTATNQEFRKPEVYAYGRRMYYGNDHVGENDDAHYDALSVRCVQNSP
jgi:uncharacterized protein (TIGR02145 family)